MFEEINAQLKELRERHQASDIQESFQRTMTKYNEETNRLNELSGKIEGLEFCLNELSGNSLMSILTIDIDDIKDLLKGSPNKKRMITETIQQLAEVKKDYEKCSHALIKLREKIAEFNSKRTDSEKSRDEYYALLNKKEGQIYQTNDKAAEPLRALQAETDTIKTDLQNLQQLASLADAVIQALKKVKAALDPHDNFNDSTQSPDVLSEDASGPVAKKYLKTFEDEFYVLRRMLERKNIEFEWRITDKADRLIEYMNSYFGSDRDALENVVDLIHLIQLLKEKFAKEQKALLEKIAQLEEQRRELIYNA